MRTHYCGAVSAADIGKTAAFLASDHAQWITGAIWPVDGGLTTN